MKKIIWCFLLVLSGLMAKADGNIMFEQANALYHSKNYDSAAKLYTQLVQNGFCSEDLYYNMGNAFYRSNKIGWAIWSYRKSMQINCNQNTKDNYQLAKKLIKQPLIVQEEIFFIRWWHSIYGLFTVNIWAILSLGAFFIFLIIFYLKTIKQKRIPTFFKYSFFVIFLFGFACMFVRYYNDVNHYQAVIVESTTFVQANAQPEKISEGEEVLILDKAPVNKTDFVEVQLSDLRQGLIAKNAIKRL